MLYLQMVKICFIYILLIATFQKSEWSLQRSIASKNQRSIESVHNGWLSLQNGKKKKEKKKLTRIKFQAKQGIFILLNINYVCIMFT